MDSEEDLVSLEERLKVALPTGSRPRSLLRRAKQDLNELLWTVKPDWPQLGESPEAAQLRTIMKNSTLPELPAAGQRILLFSMRTWRIHKIWEGLIGRGLLERGADPTVVICDGLPRCDMFGLNAPGYSAPHCRNCAAYNRQIFHLFGLPVQPMSAFHTACDRDEAQHMVASWTEDYESFEAEGLPLGELARPSLMRTLLRGSLKQDELSRRLYREYLMGGVILARAFRRMLARIQPDMLFTLSGMFFGERIGLTIAQQQGLHAVTHERGFARNRLVLAHDEPANRFAVDDAWDEAQDRPLTREQDAALDRYLASRQGGKDDVVNYWPSIESRREFIIDRLKLDPSRPILTVFTNILWDTAVYRRDVGFAGMFDWLEALIRQVGALPGLQLVVRIHPAEVRLTQKTRERVLDRLAAGHQLLPGNVVIVPPESDISSYALIDLSTVVCVYTSTVGLEATLRGVPVLVAGQTHYRGKGFTHDVESATHLAALLGTAAAWPRVPEEQVALARRYAHLFFLQNMLPIDLVTEDARGSVRFNFDSFAALKPGRHPVLDQICTAMLEHKPFSRPFSREGSS
jgi:hypothetical protein